MRAPSLFIGHGSPMNTIEDNDFTRTLRALGARLPRPDAILVISAHWLTDGTQVTDAAEPRMIYDMSGFPKPLYQFKYPAKGSAELAALVSETVQTPKVSGDAGKWGLDHGTYSVLASLYPRADIPVVQLSIDIQKPGAYHYELGKQLRSLRERNIMILGSGNIVHNLRKIDWKSPNSGYDWASTFDDEVKTHLVNGDHAALFDGYKLSSAGQLSVPTPEHYYPLLYTLGASDSKDTLKFEFEELQMGSLSMRTFSLS